MIKKLSELKEDVIENFRGGDGSVTITHLADPAQMYKKNRLFAIITVKPNCSVGYHVHEKETEIYHIISGSGLYDDNGITAPLSPGDVTVTPAGHGHGISNSGNTDLEMIALIILE